MKRMLLALVIVAICYPLALWADVGSEGTIGTDEGEIHAGCGNGIVDAGEQCDDASLPDLRSRRKYERNQKMIVPTSKCYPFKMVCNEDCFCVEPTCGDGVVQNGDWEDGEPYREKCDPAAKPIGCPAGQVCDSRSCRCKVLQVVPEVQKRELKRRPIQIQR